MTIALKGIKGDLFLDLKAYNSFMEIKEELVKRLQTVDDYMIGTLVNIDIGQKHFTNKQIKEIEDILLDHGLYLKELLSSRGPRTNEFEPSRQIWAQDTMSAEELETLLLFRHLRSGQKITAEGNVVIVGDVNPGAEIIAEGNILVMGALKGMAHAGASGDETALIAAYRLSPIQLRIAGHVTRPPDDEPNAGIIPEIAKIKAGKVVIEKLKI